MCIYKFSDIVPPHDALIYNEDMSVCILGFVDQWGVLNSRRDDIPYDFEPYWWEWHGWNYGKTI